VVQETEIMWVGTAVLLALLTLIIGSKRLVAEPSEAGEAAAMKRIALNMAKAAGIGLALLSLAGCIIEDGGGRGGDWHHGGGWEHGDHYH
jgi:hypothetical protein